MLFKLKQKQYLYYSATFVSCQAKMEIGYQGALAKPERSNLDVIVYKSTMKTSETWNQAFEEMKFDNQRGHIVSEDHFQPSNNQHFIFESQELAIGRTPLQSQQSQANLNNIQYPDSNSARGQERYQYSQTEPGQSLSQPRKEEESQIEDKSLRILDNSNLSNLPQEQSRNRGSRGQLQASSQQSNNHLIIQVHPKQAKSKTQIMRTPPHYIPVNSNPAFFQQHQYPPGYNELETLPLPPQQSYAPSQKTLVMPHAQGLAPTSPVFRSHLATERLQSQFLQKADKNILNSGSRSNFQINSMMRQDTSLKSVVHNNQQSRDNFSDRNPQVSEAQWWRDKYQQLRHHFEVNKANDMAELEAASNHIQTLERENRSLKDNYDKLAAQLRKKGEDQKNFKQESGLMSQANDSELKRQLEERGMLISLLKKENEQLKKQLQNRGEVIQRWQAEYQELQENISVLKMQLQQKDDYIIDLKKNESQIKQNDISQFSRSRVQSVENTKIMELEMQAGRLMTEMAARDESYEQELKLNALKFNELADKYQATVTEKDQVIRNLQEKVAILDSDLNKKDSLLRNLRDELLEAERKKTSHIHNSHIHSGSPKHSTTSASAINLPHQRAERPQNEAKRQIDNLRKHLFDKERQLTIQMQRQQEIKEILAEAENTASRRKNEMQALRRQIADYEDKMAEFQMLKETLQKKNEELVELREILIEKQYSGQYQSLTKQNQKLRQISIKRNAEISDLNERLLAAQKKIREQEGFNPQIEALEEEVQILTNHIRSMQSQIQQLTVSLEHSNEKILEAELQVQRERERQAQLENLLQEKQNQIQELQINIERQGKREQLLERQLESLATKMVKVQKENQDLKQVEQHFVNQLSFYQNQLSNRTVELQAVSQKKIELDMIRSTSLREIREKEEKYQQEIRRRDHEIQSMTSRIKELEAQTKLQKDKLLKIEPEMESLRQKQQKHHNCERHINQLSEKVINYEMKMLGSAYARQLFHDYPMPTTKIFENKLIYELKSQNQRLKDNIRPNRAPFTSSTYDQQQVQLRLQQRHEEQPSMRRVKSQQTFFSQPNQTPAMKLYKLGTKQKQSSISVSPVHNIEQLERFYNQKLNYYRTTNFELQERNNTLLRMNRELKDSLEKISLKQEQKVNTLLQQELQLEREKNKKLERQLEGCKKNQDRMQEELRQVRFRQRRFESPSSVSYSYTLKKKAKECKL